MNINNLLKLFPGAKANEQSSLGKSYFTIPAGSQWIHIPETAINDREKKLMTQLIAPEPLASNLSGKPWAYFLLENSKAVPSAPSHVQLLHLLVKEASGEEAFDQELWLEAFRQSLPFVQDGFFETREYGIIVLHNPAHVDLIEELEGILNVLDDDFGVQTVVYLGENWPVDEQLPALCSEERRIFRESRAFVKSSRITRLAQIALPHYTQAASLQSLVLRGMKQALKGVEDSHDLIWALWNNQGNISKAAQALYLHRNTLQYRLDRFFEATGLNLKNMDDLLLSYLVVTAQIEGDSATD